MNSRSKHCLLFVGIAALFALVPTHAFGQQVTYYNFDTPATTAPPQYSYSCSATNSPSNPLFCFNFAGSDTDPSFIHDPASTGPYAVQMTYPAAGQAASMWFSVPQVVSGGFNTWFEFRFTPSSGSTFTADGIAFVVQNAQGGGAVDPSSTCRETGSGPTVLGGGGGCMGYSGIDNSVALEFDTFFNSYDPEDFTHGYQYDDNHIALQDCGAGQVNSSAHIATSSGPACEVYLPGPNNSLIPTLVSNPHSSTAAPVPVVMSDGYVHQVVVVYNGPNDSPANYLYVYLDPTFDPGTVTPAAGSVPVFSGPYDITHALNLLDTGSGQHDSAYVGFTSATGGSYEQNELLAWTFTAHTPVTQQQPLQPAGSPTYTQFPFGTHTYGVQYPPDSSSNGSGPSTSGISMTVTANTVSPALFSQLIAGTPFQGSVCQVYDDTGGNCVIYSVSCFNTGHPDQIVACPAVTSVQDCQGNNASSCINIKTVYNNDSVPPSPGFIQGDPFYSQISALSVSGDTATFTCTGECSVTDGQTVSVVGAEPSGFNGAYIVGSNPGINTFSATTSVAASGSATTPGYLTSSNVQNIFTSWTSQNIDGGAKGTTLNFSDFVFTSQTNNAGTQTQLSADPATLTVGQPDQLTATVIGATTQVGPPTGTVLFYAGATLICTSPVSTVATATCSYTPTSAAPVTLSAQYQGDSAHFLSNSNQLSLTPLAGTPTMTFTPAPGSQTYGTPISAGSLDATASYNNTPLLSTDGTITYTTTINSNPNQPVVAGVTVLPVGSYTITATFTPSNSNYTSASTTAPYSVTQVTPTVTWPTASSINYGQALSASTFTGGSALSPVTNANVQGVFAFTTPSTVPPAGTALQGVTFTPTDTNDYAGATGSVSVTVNKGAVTIVTPPTPSAITFGQSLAASTFTGGIAKAGSTVVSGVFTYTAPATAPGAGTPPEAITFTPADTGDYSGTTGLVNVTVNKAPTSIATAPAASAILYGQTLAASTLTGGLARSTITNTAVSGTFIFTSPATAPTATGAQGITFIPADTVDYLGTTGSVSVTVTPAPLAKVSPSNIDFGTLYLGDIRLVTVTITNTGNAAMTISDPLLAIVRGGNSNEFATLNLCPKSLAAGKMCTMVVTFIAGPFYTPQTATLTIKDNAAGNPQTVPLTATVINPVAAFNPGSLNLGTVKSPTGSSTKSITVTSAGGTALSITNVGVTGKNAGDFTPSTSCSGSLAPKATCSISVTFRPGAKGARSATLVVTDNEKNSPSSIPLSGTGN